MIHRTTVAILVILNIIILYFYFFILTNKFITVKLIYKPIILLSVYCTDKSSINLNETLIQIKKELVANNFMLNRILSKVLETNLGSNNLHSASANQYLDSSFLLMFRINNKEQF